MPPVFTPQPVIQQQSRLGEQLLRQAQQGQANISPLSPFANLLQGISGGLHSRAAQRGLEGNQALRAQALQAASGGDLGALLASGDPGQGELGLRLLDRRSAREQTQANADRTFGLKERNVESQIAARDAKTATPSTIPAQMGFSKEQTGRFNAAKALGASDDEALSEAVSTSSERTKNVKVDQAIKSLNRGLDRFEKTATKSGAILNPFSTEAQGVQSMRRGIQLQLKELFDLGVLNGPDLALMDQVLFDPQLSLNPVGGAGMNIPVNAVERTKASVREIKKIVGDIRAGRRLPSQFGQPSTPALQPNNPTITPAEASNDVRGVPQTATNPQTGERIQFNPQTGQWEPIS